MIYLFFKFNINKRHPSEDIRNGEILIKRVYEAFRKSPRWEDTILLLNYGKFIYNYLYVILIIIFYIFYKDEHGGFFDHKIPVFKFYLFISLKLNLYN